MAELVLPHRFHYDTSRLVPAVEIAESLVALNAMLQRTRPMLEVVFEDTHIDRLELYVHSIRSGSLTNNVIVKLLWKDQKSFEKAVTRARKRLKIDSVSDTGKIVVALVLGATLYGAWTALERWGASEEVRLQIEANNNTIIAVGSEATHMTADEIRQLIAEVLGRQNATKVANDAIRLLRPAKGAPGGSLATDADERLIVSPDTVSAVPSGPLPERTQYAMENHDNIELEIRATDLDSLKQGWAARIPALSIKRIPMELDGAVNPTKLGSGKIIRGDVSIATTSESGKPRRRRAYLRRIVEDQHEGLTPSHEDFR